MTELVHTIAEVRERCDAARREGKRVGFVPTMGALHDGHLSLMDIAKDSGADYRVVSVFVNPLQFAPDDDLDRYPRTLQADVAGCEKRDVDLVFAPSPEEMYGSGTMTEVRVGTITERWEGEHRKGHFEGVATVVTKLFQIIGPSISVFGRKDYQQWRLIDRMVRDLSMPIEVIGAPIVRERDGLALSSRNRYLSSEERSRALCISRGLRAAKTAFENGEQNGEVLRRIVEAEVRPNMDRVDYVAAASPETLLPIESEANHIVLLVAAHVGKTRLIDNLELSG